jgi:uncharacterized BrkB/YihY/UPF0761 family membrane protein
MSEEESKSDLSNLLSDAFPESMVTNWIVIAETITSESRSLQLATSEGMTTWLASGMLNCAGDIVLNQQYDVDFDVSEDDDD